MEEKKRGEKKKKRTGAQCKSWIEGLRGGQRGRLRGREEKKKRESIERASERFFEYLRRNKPTGAGPEKPTTFSKGAQQTDRERRKNQGPR